MDPGDRRVQVFVCMYAQSWSGIRMGSGEEEAIDPERRVGRHLELISRESKQMGLCQRPEPSAGARIGRARCLADGMLCCAA